MEPITCCICLDSVNLFTVHSSCSTCVSRGHIKCYSSLQNCPGCREGKLSEFTVFDFEQLAKRTVVREYIAVPIQTHTTDGLLFATNFNIFRIMSGMGGVAYAN